MRKTLAATTFGLSWLLGAGAAPMGAQTLYAVSRDDDQIRVIDRGSTPWVFVSARTLVLPPPAVVVGAWGLADDPLTTGELWIVYETADGALHRRLGRIQIASCTATECAIQDRGDLSDRFEGIASLCDGDLHGVTGEQDTFGTTTETLYHRLDSCTPALCSPVTVGPLDNGSLGEAIAIHDYDLFHVSGDQTFERLNLPTGELVNIGISGGPMFGQPGAMAWYPPGFSFLVATLSDLYWITPSGVLSGVPMNGLIPINGLAFLDASCPALFADGFETNDVSRWSSVHG